MTSTDPKARQIRPFDQSLPMGLLKARETAMRVFRPMLAANDLSEQQWRVLRSLSAAPGPIDAGKVAAQTFLLAPSLSRILADLEKRELIERYNDPDDQRRSLIGLARSGVELVRRIGPQSESLYQSIEEAFGHERLQHLMAELQDLAALEMEFDQSLQVNSADQ